MSAAAGPPAPYKSGDVLNQRYIVEGEINRGATAVVYAGRDAKQGNRPVALKVLDCPQHVPVRVVRREIALSSAVGGHPNLAALLDVFAASRRELVIVWERVHGPDVLTLLNEKGGPLDEDEAAFLLAQLLRAVAFLHSSGFAHRDIKPENALVERATGRLRLIDFGLSKHISSVATLGVGTPDYMAPELLLQQQHMPPSSSSNNNIDNTNTSSNSNNSPQPPPPPPYDTRAADAWALGVLTFLLLAGAYPFEDEHHPTSVAHTVSNVLAARRRPLPEGLSPGAARVVAGLLERDPRRRTDLRALASDPWLVEGAGRHARGVQGGIALVDLSAVAGKRAPQGAGAEEDALQGQGQRPAVAAAAEAAPVAPPPAAAALTGGKKGEPQQQQPGAPTAPAPPPPPAPKAGLVQRLMASMGLRNK